jgi:thiamine transport system ATP-binding protein
MTHLKVENLTYTYPKTKGAFSYTFSVSSEKPALVCAPSGKGKTTLFNLLAGFLRPQEGRIVFEQTSWNNLSTQERPVSYLMQDHPVLPYLTVFENIALGRPASEEPEIREIAHRLEIASLLSHKASDISGGQKQRTLLAQVLMQKRAVVLLDEPFKGIDPTAQALCLEVIRAYQGKTQSITLLALHESSALTQDFVHL